MWLFDEAAGAIYQVGDGTASSSSSKSMIGAEDCNEEDDLALLPAVALELLPAVALDILEIEVSLVTAALDTEDGTWVVVDVDAIAWLSALVISLALIFIVFIYDCGFRVV